MNVQLDWKIIDSYFSSNINTKYISQHHISSYNTFTSTKLPYIIKTLNPYVIFKNDENGVKYTINVYIGGRDGNSIKQTNPCNTDYVNNKKNVLLPNNARLKDYSYESNLLVDIVIDYITHDNDGTQSLLTYERKDLQIGNIPVMLHSDLCILKNMNSHEMILIGECP